jgi:hypothetical protein
MGRDIDYALERGKAYEQVFNNDKTYGVALGGDKIND